MELQNIVSYNFRSISRKYRNRSINLFVLCKLRNVIFVVYTPMCLYVLVHYWHPSNHRGMRWLMAIYFRMGSSPRLIVITPYYTKLHRIILIHQNIKACRDRGNFLLKRHILKTNQVIEMKWGIKVRCSWIIFESK